MKVIQRIAIAAIAGLVAFAVAPAQNKYVGANACKMCHQGAKKGDQFKIWQGSKHANAYKVLSGPEAQKIRKGAEKDPECLACHTTGHGMDAAMFDKKFSMEDGVQCEACHGAGDKYKSMSTMKDHGKAVAAGMTDFKKEGAIEKQCKTCHNEKSPTYKGFKLDEMLPKIAHPAPKG